MFAKSRWFTPYSYRQLAYVEPYVRNRNEFTDISTCFQDVFDALCHITVRINLIREYLANEGEKEET